MGSITIEDATLSQRSPATAIQQYVPANADIGDNTGVLLAMFAPLPQAAVTVASEAVGILGSIEVAAAAGGYGIVDSFFWEKAAGAVDTLSLETIASSIQDFAEAKTSVLDELGLLEDLLSGAGRSVTA